MSRDTRPAKTETLPVAATCSEVNEDAIRDYAFHLYEQGGCAPGHDLENWLEATACLKANIPRGDSHTRLHLHAMEPAASSKR